MLRRTISSTRTVLHLMTLLVLLATVTAGCVAPVTPAPAEPAMTEQPTASETTTQAEPAAPGEPVRVLVPPGGTQAAIVGGLETVAADTGVEVNVESLPMGEVRQQEILDLSTQAGNLDIITNLNQWVGELNPHLVPLNDRIEADPDVTVDQFVAGVPDLFTTDGQLYSLPVRMGGRVLVYRKDLLEQAGAAGPPKTYTELKALAEKLTTGDQYGFIINLGQDLHMLDSWSTVFLDFGGQFLDEEGKAAFNSQAGVDSLQYILDLYNAGIIPPDAVEMDDGGLIAAMQQGRGAMAVAFSGWFGPMINPEASQFSDELAVAPMPYAEGSGLDKGPSLLSVWAWGISKSSDNQDAAWEVIKYITSPEVQKDMAVNHGNGPTVAAIYQDPDFVQANPAAPDILAALSGGRSQPPHPKWSSVADILMEELTRAIIGDVTPQEALDSAAERANVVLAE